MSTLAAKFKEHFNFLEVSNKVRFLPFRFLKLDNGKYFLSNFIGEYIVLEPSEFTLLRNKTFDKSSGLFFNLKSKHFIIDSESDVGLDLLAIKYRTKQSLLDSFTSLHMFVVTLRCDHSCPYCQVSRQNEDTQAFDMSKEDADKALDYTFRSPTQQLKIEFQGGESLLNFELIKYIVLQAEKRNEIAQRDLQFVIATNLSPVNDEILDFCKIHNILISTSLDGPEHLHNKNRPKGGNDSHQRAVNGINLVRERLGPDQVAALMTTTVDSLKYPKEIVDEYIAQGFKSIFLRSLSPYGFAIKTKSYDLYNTEAWLDFYKQGLDYIIEINKSGFFFVEEYTSLILQKMLTPFPTGFVDLQSPTGAGISAVVFNYDGDVYASDESRMLAEMGMKDFRLGNLQKDSYEDMAGSNLLVDTVKNTIADGLPMCSDCAFLPYCGTDPVYHMATQGDTVGHKMKSGYCKKNMGVFKHIVNLLENDESAREVLLRWIRV